MSFPLRNLPVMQNWDCHSCGDCCRRMEGVITDLEKQRIEGLDLANDPEIAPKPWFAPLPGLAAPRNGSSDIGLMGVASF